MEKRKRPPLPLDASPQEKYDNLILTFFEEWQEYQGQKVNLEPFTRGVIPNHLGFDTPQEYEFYRKTLVLDGLFELHKAMYKGDVDSFSLSFKGLNYCLSLLSSGKNSNNCFVAMKYGDEKEPYMTRYYDEGIVEALKENGFHPIRVDREHVEREQTINDFIIAKIKQSRFCVADLTHQSNGAYFEAGYALGRGLKVIYTCHRDDWHNLHFDVRNLQVLKYASVEELRRELSLKIQAFVED